MTTAERRTAIARKIKMYRAMGIRVVRSDKDNRPRGGRLVASLSETVRYYEA